MKIIVKAEFDSSIHRLVSGANAIATISELSVRAFGKSDISIVSLPVEFMEDGEIEELRRLAKLLGPGVSITCQEKLAEIVMRREVENMALKIEQDTYALIAKKKVAESGLVKGEVVATGKKNDLRAHELAEHCDIVKVQLVRK